MSSLVSKEAAVELGKLADEINARLEKAGVHETKADNMKISAGQYLVQARDACQREGIPWQRWVKENVRYSYPRAMRLIGYAESNDPYQAIADDRAGRRQRHEKQKASGGPIGADRLGERSVEITGPTKSDVDQATAAFSPVPTEEPAPNVWQWGAAEELINCALTAEQLALVDPNFVGDFMVEDFFVYFNVDPDSPDSNALAQYCDRCIDGAKELLSLMEEAKAVALEKLENDTQRDALVTAIEQETSKFKIWQSIKILSLDLCELDDVINDAINEEGDVDPQRARELLVAWCGPDPDGDLLAACRP